MSIKLSFPRKQPNPEAKLGFSATYRLVSLSVFGILIISSAIIFFYLYRKTFLTIGQARNLLMINQSLSQEVIDFEKFNHVETWKEKKKTVQTAEIKKDPFFVEFKTTSSTQAKPVN